MGPSDQKLLLPHHDQVRATITIIGPDNLEMGKAGSKTGHVDRKEAKMTTRGTLKLPPREGGGGGGAEKKILDPPPLKGFSGPHNFWGQCARPKWR